MPAPRAKKEESLGTKMQQEQTKDNLELCPDPSPCKKDPEKEVAKEKKKLLKKKEKLEADLAQVINELAALEHGIGCTAQTRAQSLSTI